METKETTPSDVVIILDDIIGKEISEEIKSKVSIKIEYVETLFDFQVLLKRKRYNCFFLIDVHLGALYPDGGIDMIQKTRHLYPNSLIVGYSSYNGHEQKVIDAGADFFIRKSVRTWNDDLKKLTNAINEFFCKNKDSD